MRMKMRTMMRMKMRTRMNKKMMTRVKMRTRMSNKDEDGLMPTYRKRARAQVVRYRAPASAQAA